MATPFLAQQAEDVLAGTTPQTFGISPLDSVLSLLTDFGFFRVVLPFLLIFAIFYAIILKTGVLGKESDAWAKPTASIISLVAAFLVIAYSPVVNALTVLIPQASFLLVIALLVLMLFTFIGFQPTDMFGKPSKWMLVIVIPLIIIFVAMIGFAIGPEVPVLYGISQGLMGGIELTPATMNLMIGLAIILGIPLIVVLAVVLAGGKKTP